ncbi:MAG: heavy metal translocating P-type ATPase [Bacilli bacterium]|nr:heavy metal translocating P-type ATPase [Bacilli bacterium]
MKKSYKIEKINNRRNFRRITSELKRIDKLTNFNLNIDKNILYVEYPDEVENMEERLLKAFHTYEKHTELVEIVNQEVYRRVLKLKGLDCGHCAARIEDLARKSLDNERIVVDFSTERFILETKDEYLYNNAIDEVAKIAHKVDPRIQVLDPATRIEETDEEEKSVKDKVFFWLFIGGILLTIVYVFGKSIYTRDFSWLLHADPDEHALTIVDYIVLITSFILVGLQVILEFFRNIFRRHEMDETFLMTIASIGAICTGHIIEAISVMSLYQIGEYLQELAVNHSRKSIKELLSFEVSKARIKSGDEELEVDVESILPGDVLIIKTGEMIPVDGVITSGKTYLDLKALTGESAYASGKAGDAVRSGTINMGNVIEVAAKKMYRDSTMSQILDMVENASAAKAKTENFITKFAKAYTPSIVVIALLVAFVSPFFIKMFNQSATFAELFLGNGVDKGSIYKGMVFLVISCPCALVISVPLAFFSGIGLASKNGILVKGSNYLEALNKVDVVLLDKTGTLTKGEFSVKEIVSTSDISKDELHKLMAYAEYHSTHPIGASIVESYGRENIFSEIIDDFVHVPGRGVRAIINGNRIIVCNYRQLLEHKIEFEQVQNPDLVLYVIKERTVIGYVVIGDTIRTEAPIFMKRLHKQGVKEIAILTGDNTQTSNAVGATLGVDNIYSELLPQEKVAILDDYKEKPGLSGNIVYVGDGINDAPVISAADVGVALGATASKGSIAIADVVIMSDNLTKINDAITIAKATRRVVLQNIIFALAIKTIVMVLVFFNIPIMMWLAIFSDVGVSLIAIVNSLRVTRVFNRHNKGESHE